MESSPTTVDARNPDSVLKQAAECFREPRDTFVRGMYGIGERMLKGWTEEYQIFLATTQTLVEQTGKHVEEAQGAYTAALTDIEGSQGGPRSRTEAYSQYAQLIQEARAEAQKRYEEAARQYVEGANKLSAEASSEWAELYAGYLKGLQAAWAGLDIDGVVAACAGITKSG